MKKLSKCFSTLVFTFVFVFMLIPCDLNAAVISSASNTTYEYFSDGSMLITTINTSATQRTTGTITGSKNQYYRDSSGNDLWSITLTGTFTFNGTSSKCTKASISSTIYSSDWSISTSKSSYSGSTATGTIVAQTKSNGIILKTQSLTVTLTCDKNGNLS